MSRAQANLGRHMQTFGHPLRTACTQFLLSAAIALPKGGFWGSLSAGAAFAAGTELLLLGVGPTALDFGFQTIAQRYTSATHAAVIVCAEGVFSAAAASVFLGERISFFALLSAALMLAAIVDLAFGSAARDGIEQSGTKPKWLGSRLQRARIVNSTL